MKKHNASQYLHDNKNLMEKWIQRCSAETENLHFVKDGIVDPTTWFSLGESEERVLILLKEAYDTNKGHYVWDLTKWLCKQKCMDDKDVEFCTKKDTNCCADCGSGGSRTYNRVAEWLHGIKNCQNRMAPVYDNWIGIPNKDKTQYNQYRDTLLCRAAVVNVRKANGTPCSDHNLLMHETQKHADLIAEQIQLIRPTLIICGGTYQMLRCVYPQLPTLPDSKNGCANLDGTKVIATYHPSAYMKGQKMYESIMKHYQTLIAH